MATAERRAEVYWEGELEQGAGSLALGNWMVGEEPATWSSRIGSEEDNASPEELLAAAQASCYSMALSSVLGEQGTTPERMNVSTVCTLDEVEEGRFRITAIELDVRGSVPSMNAEGFQEAVERADSICPVTNALKGNVDIRIQAHLEEG
ncbi:MAG: OsmC family peroxiredoxin [Rubrobacteraceae bacterium]